MFLFLLLRVTDESFVDKHASGANKKSVILESMISFFACNKKLVQKKTMKQPLYKFLLLKVMLRFEKNKIIQDIKRNLHEYFYRTVVSTFSCCIPSGTNAGYFQFKSTLNLQDNSLGKTVMS